MLLLVSYKSLEFDEYDSFCFHSGIPFTGICYDTYHAEQKSDQISDETSYYQGTKHGFERIWYSGGGIECEYELKNGYPHGVSWEWFLNGFLKSETLWKHNITITNREWNDQGDLINEYNIDNEPDSFAYELLYVIISDYDGGAISPELNAFNEEIAQYILKNSSSNVRWIENT